MDQEYVKVKVRLTPEEGLPSAEWPWAVPVHSDDAGGTYALANNLIYASLWHGDVVRCELDGDSFLQVVEVVSLVEGNVYTFQHPTDSEADVVPALDEMIALGYLVSRPVDGWVEVLVPGSARDVPVALVKALPAQWVLMQTLRSSDRAKQVAAELNVTLDTSTFLLTPDQPMLVQPE